MKNLIRLQSLGLIILVIFLHSCKKREVPTLTTSEVTNITGTSATSGGTITDEGSGTIVERGICWSKKTSPTIADDRTIEDGGAGTYISNMSDLDAATTYYVRAYATNEAGTGYGMAMSFTTLGDAPTATTQSATNVTTTSATLNGVVNANYLSTTVTFEYGTTTTYGSSIAATPSPVTGNSITNVSADISGLTPGTIYHYRVRSVNSIGTTNGNDLIFTTVSAIPTLTTIPVSNVSANSAITGGNITSDGGASVTTRGVCWATTADPTISNNKTTDGTGSGNFNSTITGLQPSTIYHVRAYATNNSGTAYGNDLTFTTLVVVPLLTTTSVTAITQTTATSGGSISSDGGSSVTARGVCWATTANPTTINSKTTDGPGTNSFISNLTGLQPGTLYYMRAYATNSAGTAYGNELTFTTSANTPTITTAAISAITSNSAVSGGNITTDGGAPVTSRGICWKTSSNPTISDSHTSDGTGSGTFTGSLTGLQPNTKYYVRAYATNSAGTGYGNEIVFDTNPIVVPTVTTTAASSVTSTTAVSGGNVTSNGGGTVTARGVCWSTSANPTISGSKTTDGTGTGTFTSNIAGLQAGTTYYIRAYATNSAGTGYGDDLTFTTTSVVPTLTTAAVTAITQNTATSGGNITSNGGAAITTRGVCWGTSASPTTAGSHTIDGTGNGVFTSSITGLTPGTLYYVRAYATNSVGTAYGNQVTFTSSTVSLPVVTTAAVTSVSLTAAVSGGNVTSSGGGSVTARGVCWSTSSNPTISDSHSSDGTGTGSFTSNISGLNSGTTYYVRAFATNSAGTAYGAQVEFSTSIADIEGNIYRIVRIGTQMWMAENLRTAKYNDNTDIPYVTDNTAWSILTTPAYCWYGNNIGYKPTYGALYNWITVTTDRLCPTGWHVPSDSEFNTMELYLGIPSAQIDNWGWRGTNEGSEMKSTSGWAAGENGTNTSGFTALPGGYRYAADGGFYSLGTLAYWWTATLNGSDVAWYRRLDGPNSDIYKGATSIRGGKFIRCVKN